jgi:hypothetical protein
MEVEVVDVHDEVLTHLTALPAADVTVTLDIRAAIRQGVSEQAIRTVWENARELGFRASGFEEG